MQAKAENLLKDKTTETIPDEVEVIWQREFAQEQIHLDVSKYQPKNVPSLTWRECIKKIWKSDPLICPSVSHWRKGNALPGMHGNYEDNCVYR